MRTFIFTYNRYDSISTPMFWEEAGLDHTVLCHTEEAAEQFIEHGRVNPDRLIATGEPKGLAHNRNAALDMMEDGEWALFLVDDLKSLTEVADYDTRTAPTLGINLKNQKQIAPTMKQPLTPDRFMERCDELATACETVGAKLGGYAGIDNPLFRDRKWKFNSLADGRCWVVQKSSLRLDTGAHSIDDYCWTAQNIDRYGVVVVNQWVLPDCARYTPGGYGSIEDRMPQKLKETRHLVNTYPHLIAYKDKKGHPPGGHVTIRRTLGNDHRRALEEAVLQATRPTV